MVAQHCRGDHADEVVAFDEFAAMVVEEAAVEIAVPGNAEIGARLAHGGAGAQALFRQKRVRDAVRQARIGFVIEAHEFEGQVRLEHVEDWPGAAIAGMDHDLHRPQRLACDGGKQPLDIGLARQDVVQVPARGVILHRRQRDFGQDDLFQRIERVLARRGACSREHHLQSVIVGRVVACRDHQPRIGAARGGVEIDFLRAANAQRKNVDAAVQKPLRQRQREGRAFLAHVVADDDRARRKLPPNRLAEAVHEGDVDLLRDPAANIVSLERRPHWQTPRKT